MLSNQEDQAERRRILENDRKVREQQREQAESRRVFAPDQSLPNPGTTFHARAQADADIPRGRFTEHERSTVIGSTPTPATAYPAGPAWSADPGSQCVEPPLGFDNPALEPSVDLEQLSSCTAQATGPTSAAAPSTPLGQRTDVGSSFSREPTLHRRRL
jgi:hypothetical protein